MWEAVLLEAVLWKLHIVYTAAWAGTPQTVAAVAYRTASVAGCMQGCKMASVASLQWGCRRALQELLVGGCKWAFGGRLEGGIMYEAGYY